MTDSPGGKCAVLLLFWCLCAPVVSHPGVVDQIDVFTHKIAHNPKSAELYMRRGLAYSDNAQYTLALADFHTAGAMGNAQALGHDIGVVYYRMGNFEKALHYFDAFLDQFPRSFPTYEYRARVKRDMGNNPGAVADLERYFTLVDKPNPGHYVSAADMLAQMNGNSADAALALLDRGIAALGVIPQLQRRAIALERGQGRMAQAIERMQTLEPVLGSSPAWQVDMAELLIQAHRKDDAQKLLEVAHSRLAGLRVTPARVALSTRVATLQSEIQR